jgi:hypothetical protein
MFEYILFHASLRDEFTHELDRLAISYQVREDPMGLVVAIPEDIDDDMIDQVDAFYEALVEKSEALFEDEGEGNEKHVAGITVSLHDGRTVQAAIRPELMNKLLEVLSYRELNELVEAVVSAVEQPDARPLCQR